MALVIQSPAFVITKLSSGCGGCFVSVSPASATFRSEAVAVDTRLTASLARCLNRPDRTTEERERERRADRERYSKMLKRFGWTDADCEAAKRFGFPASLGRVSTGAWTSEAFFSRTAIAAWCAEVRAFAAKLPK